MNRDFFLGRKTCFLFLLLSVLAWSAPSTAQAQTFSLLYSFGQGGGSYYGGTPNGLVQGTDGSFYGTTYSGGSSGFGTVFKLASSNALTTLYDFSALNGSMDNNDGANPVGSLVQGSDGSFYGVTTQGGPHANGTVFKITSAGVLVTLYGFSAKDSNGYNSDGANPKAGLVLGNDGNFYGTAYQGGPNGDGTVFKITPTGTFTTLYSFSAVNSKFANSDGAYPDADLLQGNDGDFYGTTFNGGPNANGTIFKITSSGILTTLYSFSGTDSNGHNSDGANPGNAHLVQGGDGNFYGSTPYGGLSGEGTIFKLSSAGTLTSLYSFSTITDRMNNDGANPFSPLIQTSDGSFYGTTFSGGSAGFGTVFRVTSSGSLTTLVDFTGSNGQVGGPMVLGSDGNLYGTTCYGGSEDVGTIFKLAFAGPTPTWTARDVAAAPDGTARMLWTRGDGAAGVWVMSPTDTQTTIGPIYGPYPGWTAKAVSVAGDGTSRVLWTNTNGMAGVWTFNAQGTETVIGPTYGPYAGWAAADIATAPNGTSRLLWTNDNGQAGVWTLNAADTESVIGATYGPYSGWTATAVGAAGDGTTRVLWTNTNGEAGVWSFNAADMETIIGKTYGPYTGWSAGDLSTSSDGTSKVLWRNVSGAAGVWTFSAADVETTIGATYGPYSGYSAAALDCANDQSRVLWVNSSRAAGIWTFGASDTESIIGPTYGPY